MKKKTIRKIVRLLGFALILGAVGLFSYNMYVQYSAGQEAEQILSAFESVAVSDDSTTNFSSDIATGSMNTEPELDPTRPMPEVEINGYNYVGRLDIPDIGISLPVMSEWSYKRLRVSPCRFTGSAYSDDLVVIAHNYSSHFGKLSSLKEGARLLFTDAEGRALKYSLSKIETVVPSAVEEVTHSEWDLTLVTCTPGGRSRVVARFTRDK